MSESCNYHVQHRAWQRKFLRELIAASGNSMSQAAKKSGLNRTHFYKLCRSLGVTEVIGLNYLREGNRAWQELGRAEAAAP